VLALGAAVGLSLDLPHIRAERLEEDDAVARMRASTPPRLALLGSWWDGLAIALSLRATSDVEFADVTESRGCENIARLAARWEAAGRPIYVMRGPPGHMKLECLPPGFHVRRLGPGVPLL